MEEQTKIPVFKASLIYGAIIGVAMIVFNLLLYFTEQSLKTWAMIVSPVLYAGLLVMVLIMFRNEYGKGYAPFGRLVLLSLLVGVVASVFSAGYTVAIYEADDAYLQDVKYFAIDKIDKQYDKMDARFQERYSDDEYEMIEDRMMKTRKKSIKKIQEREPASFALLAIPNSIFMTVLIGLIAGIFIKKDNGPIIPKT